MRTGTTTGVHGTFCICDVGVWVAQWSTGSHFVKEDLPRIRYANPAIDIQVTKLLKTKEESWKPEMEVELSASIS